jgi:hypothetical protein
LKGHSAQWFTQKERDKETGLDYFGARYYNQVAGNSAQRIQISLGLKKVVNPRQRSVAHAAHDF